MRSMCGAIAARFSAISVIYAPGPPGRGDKYHELLRKLKRKLRENVRESSPWQFSLKKRILFKFKNKKSR